MHESKWEVELSIAKDQLLAQNRQLPVNGEVVNGKYKRSKYFKMGYTTKKPRGSPFVQ